ncbi:HAD-IIB family hydrolase, partial [Streptococcus mutans]|nr:HAD-IIB family hydrolase [Streptococcus mutans]
MSIKLVAVDIDGTLLNSKREVTPEVYTAIQDAKKAGVKVVIATGRPIAGVTDLLEKLNLKDQGDYVITFNGALVQDTATGEDLIKETLTYDDYLDIELLSRKLSVHMHKNPTPFEKLDFEKDYPDAGATGGFIHYCEYPVLQ